jgi:hypothetical protein
VSARVGDWTFRGSAAPGRRVARNPQVFEEGVLHAWPARSAAGAPGRAGAQFPTGVVDDSGRRRPVVCERSEIAPEIAAPAPPRRRILARSNASWSSPVRASAGPENERAMRAGAEHSAAVFLLAGNGVLAVPYSAVEVATASSSRSTPANSSPSIRSGPTAAPPVPARATRARAVRTSGHGRDARRHAARVRGHACNDAGCRAGLGRRMP